MGWLWLTLVVITGALLYVAAYRVADYRSRRRTAPNGLDPR